jgi:hypothetical protein
MLATKKAQVTDMAHPQMTRTLDPSTAFFPRYTYATRWRAQRQRVLKKLEYRSHLSKIELRVRRRGSSLDLEETGVGPCVPLATLVSEYAALGVESCRRHLRKGRVLGAR